MTNTVKVVEIDHVREKLIKLLVNSPGLDTLYGKEEEFAENADWLISNGVTVQKWIPVTERLPEQSGEVLGYHTQWGVSRYYYHYSLLNTDWKHITHWMPLPDAPKE